MSSCEKCGCALVVIPAGAVEVWRLDVPHPPTEMPVHTPDRCALLSGQSSVSVPEPIDSAAHVTHRAQDDWTWDGIPENHPGPITLTCCGRKPCEVGRDDAMTWDDSRVTCPSSPGGTS